MRDRFLFVLAPRLAAASAVLALLVQGWRIARARNRIESESDAEYWRARGLAAAVWRLSIALVTAGHVIASNDRRSPMRTRANAIRRAPILVDGREVGVLVLEPAFGPPGPR